MRWPLGRPVLAGVLLAVGMASASCSMTTLSEIRSSLPRRELTVAGILPNMLPGANPCRS